MKIQTYTRENFMEMLSMHDFFATQILVKDKKLIIVYDNLDKDIFNIDGTPYYQHKKLTIEYMFDSYCDAELYYNYRNKKSVYLNLQEEKANLIKRCVIALYYATNLPLIALGNLCYSLVFAEKASILVLKFYWILKALHIPGNDLYHN